MVGGYLFLFIVRPWEQLAPWLAPMRFELLYALCVIAATALGRRAPLRFGLQEIAVVGFLCAIVLCGFAAVEPARAVAPAYEYGTLVVFFFLLLLVIRSPYDLYFIITSYVLSLLVYLAKAQWEFFVHGQHRYDMGVVRLVGIEDTYGGPNNLAMSIVVSLPLATLAWVQRRDFTRDWPVVHRRGYSATILLFFGVAASSVVLTNSRSGMVGLALFVLLTALRGRGLGPKALSALIGALVLVGAWLVMPEESRGRLSTIWDPKAGPASATESAEGRKAGLRAGFAMFADHVLTGVGPGNFISYRVRYLDGVPLNAHNLVGQLLGETGLVGTLLFFLVVGATLLNCRTTRRLANRVAEPTMNALGGLAAASRDAVVLLLFMGMFGHNNMRFNWLWLAAFGSSAATFARARVAKDAAARRLTRKPRAARPAPIPAADPS